MIELTQVRHGDLGIDHVVLMVELIEVGGFVVAAALGEAFDALDDPIDVDDVVSLPEGLLDPTHRVFDQQLQDADELTRPAGRPVTVFELLAELAKDRWELPIAIDRGVIQRRRPTTQRHQVVDRVQDPLVALVAAFVTGDDGIAGDELNPANVSFDRDRLERVATRDAVAVGVERGGLILVDLDGLVNTRVKRLFGQRPGGGLVAGEPLADRFSLPRHGAAHLRQAALTQIGVEFIVVLYPRHRRGPTSLKVVDRMLDIGLLPAGCGHTRTRIDRVVTHERRVTLVELTLSPPQDLCGDRLGVVPPQLLGDAVKERQRLG